MMSLPLGNPLVFFLIILIPLLLVVLFINVVEAAFQRIGLSPMMASVLVFATILGSLVNIPLRKVTCTRTVERPMASGFYHFIYPQSTQGYMEQCDTTIAINVGGAVVPLLLCIYMFARYPEYLFPWCLVTIPIMVGICYKISRVVPNVGIVMPTFVPPLMSAGLALLFAGDAFPVALSFVTGVLGVIIGADLLNLNKISRTTARTISIGGAGTFDGIFLTGIISVFLV